MIDCSLNSDLKGLLQLIGILAEKPSAARNFAKALGGAAGVYNGEQYEIVAARGHLYEFADPADQVPAALQAQYKSWAVENLPWSERDIAWTYVKKKDTAQTLKNLKMVLSRCDEVVIATDVDPSGEGELLACEVLIELKIRPKKLTRMYFTDESAKEIQKAFVNRKSLPMDHMQNPDYRKAFFRSRWDFMSMQWTRIATRFGDGKSVLRQGRLKSAMVVIVGDQLKLLSGYKKIPYYQNRFRDENGVMYTNPEEPTFPKADDVPKTYHASDVVVDSKARKTSAPPRMLDLATLSARLAPKGYKSKQVLDIYQKMYESSITSYPRTEDHTITPEQFNDMLPLVDKIARVVGVDPALLTHRTPRPTHVKKGGAHGANRPGPNVPSSLQDLGKQYGQCAVEIYTMLALNYLATLAEDYEYEAQKGHVKDYPKFVGTASVPLSMGWKAVYKEDDDDPGDAGAKGLGTRAEPFVYEGFPPKPATPTMKWLMKQLESHEVGTGATRTSTYAEVTNDKAKFPLLADKRGKISMTEYGEMSYRILPGTHIGDLKLTEQVFGEMADIAAGKADPEDCLARIQGYIRDDIKIMEQNGIAMRKELGKTMADSTYAQKEYYEGTWKGKDVRFNRTFRGKRLDDATCDDLLAGKTVEITGLKARSGSEYGVKAKLNNLEYNGRKYVGVEQVGFLDKKGVPASWCGHTFTEDEKCLLEMGKELAIDDAVSKRTGKTFSCKLVYGERDDGSTGLTPIFN